MVGNRRGQRDARQKIRVERERIGFFAAVLPRIFTRVRRRRGIAENQRQTLQDIGRHLPNLHFKLDLIERHVDFFDALLQRFNRRFGASDPQNILRVKRSEITNTVWQFQVARPVAVARLRLGRNSTTEQHSRVLLAGLQENWHGLMQRVEPVGHQVGGHVFKPEFERFRAAQFQFLRAFSLAVAWAWLMPGSAKAVKRIKALAIFMRFMGAMYFTVILLRASLQRAATASVTQGAIIEEFRP